MKKHLSIFMLISRSTIYKVLALIVAMAVIQGGMFYLTLKTRHQSRLSDGLEYLFTQSGIVWVFGIAFVLLAALLCLTGCEYGSKTGYTLNRLSVSEQSFFVWQAIYNTICFLLLWAAQLVIILSLAKLYIYKMDPGTVSNQAVFLASYRNRFLHSILPLDEISRYVRNIFIVIGLGASSAAFSFKQRRGRFGLDVVVLVSTCLVFFVRSIGSFGYDALLILISGSVAVEAIYQIYRRDPYSEA